jgi:hypothetical protein
MKDTAKWYGLPYDLELDGYPVYSPDGLAAIATDPEYARKIPKAVNGVEVLLAALLRIAECSEKEPDNTCTACGKLARATIAKAEGTK